MTPLLVAVCMGAALILGWPPRSRLRPPAPITAAQTGVRGGLVWWGVSGVVVAALTLLPGPINVIAAGLGAAITWRALSATEPPAERRRREQAERELADVVRLLGVALGSGTSLSAAVRLVARARPGPAAEAIASAERRLALGLPWQGEPRLNAPGFHRLGRALSRSTRSGAPVAEAVERLAVELAMDRRLRVADRARTVGVRAALPLGLCLLPAFLLLGIVPVVVASLRSLPW